MIAEEAQRSDDRAQKATQRSDDRSDRQFSIMVSIMVSLAVIGSLVVVLCASSSESFLSQILTGI